VAHGLDHAPIGALVSAWPALALVGSFELLMLLTRDATQSEWAREARIAAVPLRKAWHRSTEGEAKAHPE
jgi:hypothetical protein